MIPHKEYLFVKELAQQFGLMKHATTEDDILRTFCKILPLYNEMKNEAMVKEVAMLRKKVSEKCIPIGHTTIEKKRLQEHLLILKNRLAEMNIVMTEKESHERGRRLGRIWSDINFSTDSLLHFDLKIPLDDLSKLLESSLSLTKLISK